LVLMLKRWLQLAVELPLKTVNLALTAPRRHVIVPTACVLELAPIHAPPPDPDC
jgi:hypothetical protein